jgi:hypothetical protein
LIEIEPPAFAVSDVLTKIPGGPRIAIAAGKEDRLVAAEAEYIAAAPARNLHLMKAEDPALSEDEGNAVIYAYTKAATKRDGREARALLNVLEASTDDKCPLCLRTPVEELDHYLPKSPFARVALTPANLYPVCSKCNRKMSNTFVTDQTELPLHPYFDRIGGLSWLTAELTETGLGTLQFRVNRLDDWDDVTFARVTNHFESRGLGTLWGSSASNFFVGNRKYFRGIYQLAAGADKLKQTLLSLADSYDEEAYEPWRAVALRIWAESDWFCSGGWDVAA